MKLKRLIMLVFVVFTTVFMSAQKKAASPAEVASGKINDASITIKYGSPSVKGREIWGALVPYNEIWRAGANNATTFESDKDLIIEGSKLPAGKYSFFVIPTKDDYTIIFNKVPEQWGAYKYEESKDQLRVKVKPIKSNSLTEKLVYIINPDNVVLSWENFDIKLKVGNSN
jgi:Protein of unknown function (DUF2911)